MSPDTGLPARIGRPIPDSFFHVVGADGFMRNARDIDGQTAASSAPPPVEAARRQLENQPLISKETTKKILKTLSAMAGIALGALTALAIVGVMCTPVGWGIAGGALLLAIGVAVYMAYKHDDSSFITETAKYGVSGFIGGLCGVLPGGHVAAAGVSPLAQGVISAAGGIAGAAAGALTDLFLTFLGSDDG